MYDRLRATPGCERAIMIISFISSKLTVGLSGISFTKSLSRTGLRDRQSTSALDEPGT